MHYPATAGLKLSGRLKAEGKERKGGGRGKWVKDVKRDDRGKEKGYGRGEREKDRRMWVTDVKMDDGKQREDETVE